MVYRYLDTCADDLTFLFLPEVYDLFQLLCVLSFVSILPLQSYWSLSCDHGLHCSHELK